MSLLLGRGVNGLIIHAGCFMTLVIVNQFAVELKSIGALRGLFSGKRRDRAGGGRELNDSVL